MEVVTFTDITELKPIMFLSRRPTGQQHTDQGVTQGHARQDSGETQKQRITSWGKTLSSKPREAFLTACTGKCELDISKGRSRTNAVCVNYSIPAKYICFGIAQSAPSGVMFSFPVGGKYSVT